MQRFRSALMQHMRTGGLIAKRCAVVGGVLLVATVAALWVWAPWEPREPVYDGKRLSYWLTDHGGNPSERGLLEDSNAVPILIKALKRDGWIGAAVYRQQLWPRLPVMMQRRLPSPPGNAGIRRRAAFLLGEMRPTSKAVKWGLIRALREDQDLTVRSLAAEGLFNVGEGDSAVVRAMVEAVQEDKNADTRKLAAEVLGRIGAGNRACVAALVGALEDKDLWIRRYVTNALLKLDPEAAAKAGVKPPSP